MNFNPDETYKTLGYEVTYPVVDKKRTAVLKLRNDKFQIAPKGDKLYAESYLLYSRHAKGSSQFSITVEQVINDKCIKKSLYTLESSAVNLGLTNDSLHSLCKSWQKPGELERAIVAVTTFQRAIELYTESKKELYYVQFRESKGSRRVSYFAGFKSPIMETPMTLLDAMQGRMNLQINGIATTGVILNENAAVSILSTSQRAINSGDLALLLFGSLIHTNTPNGRELRIKAHKPEVVNILTGEEISGDYQWQWREADIGTERFNKLIQRFDNTSETGPMARLEKQFKDMQKANAERRARVDAGLNAFRNKQ